jgi:hypothetical protein
MSENQEPEQPETDFETVDPEIEAKRKRAQHWQWYGWGVIGMMIFIIILNLLGLFDPEFNKYTMIAIVIAYGVYVVFRRR